MKRKLFACALVGLVPLFVSSAASATLMDFKGNNLGSSVTGGNEYDSVGMTVDGISVDVTAYTITNDGDGNISTMSQILGTDVGVYVKGNSNGSLGVRSNATGDGYNMDGGSGSATDLDEGLLFSFSEMVSLDYVNFDRFNFKSNSGKGDDFNLTVDGVRVLWDFNGYDSSLLASQVVGEKDEYDFMGVSGMDFLFWADGNSDSFRIDRMKVSAVPEPASLLLLGAGLLGLGFARRKTTA